MKLLHTSDWHLGITFQGRTFTEDQKYFIDQICDIIRQENIDAVLLAGDVFNRSNPNSEGQQLYDYAVTRICGELGKIMLVIAGNHDNSSSLDTYRNLLERSGLCIEGRLRRNIRRVEIDNADIYMLPWFGTERVKSEFPEYADQVVSMDSAYQVVLDCIRENLRPGRKNIILSHAYIINASTSTSDRSAEVGQAAAISRDVFEGFDYVALGHIHGPQDIGQNIRYCGTPMKYSFGKEEKQEKSVTIIDTADMSRRLIPLTSLHERTTVTGTYEEVSKAIGLNDDQVNGYVRLQITDTYIDLSTAHDLEKVYPNLLEFQGKNYEHSGTAVTMTVEELETQANDPISIFRRFVEDAMGITASEHQISMFQDAVEVYEKGDHE